MLSIVDRLPNVTYEELVLELEATADETSQLELKEVVSDRNRIANTACALANTFGGLIVIGFVDPERTGGRIVPTDKPLDVSVRAVSALVSSIQAKSHPSVHCRGYGIAKADGSGGAIVIHVEESMAGPVEYVGGGEHRNLVVRRQRENAQMPLSNLVSLQMRRDGAASSSPLMYPDAHPLVNTRPFGGTVDDYYFGAAIAPTEYPAERRILRHSDDEELCRIVRLHCPRLNRMSEKTLVDGLLFEAVEFGSNNDKSDQALHIRVDGEIRLRMGQNRGDHPLWSQLVFLGNVYVLGSRVLQYLNIAPRASICLGYKCELDTTPPLPSTHEEVLFVDFARTAFIDFARDAVLLASRAANVPLDDNDVDGPIAKVWAQEFGGMNPGDLRDLWS